MNNSKRIKKEALFSDGTGEYIFPAEPQPGEMVTVCLRVEKNGADKVEVVWNQTSYDMKLARTEELFDYYEASFLTGEKMTQYAFRVEFGEEVCYYNKLGATDSRESDFDFFFCSGFHVPDWMKGAVIYQIYVDRFAQGAVGNDVQDGEYVYIQDPVTTVNDWNEYPASKDIGRFYGGDLEGVKDHLDYLQELGVEVIYFNPIFVSPSNHKYDIQDYEYIDPHLTVLWKDSGESMVEGCLDNQKAERYREIVTDKANLEASNAFFAEFMEEVHQRGMKVILDGVFNHCGSFHQWFNREGFYRIDKGYSKGAYEDVNSPYRNYFRFYEDKDGKPSYEGWWGHDTLPKLNYEGSEELFEYIMKIARKWVSPPFCADGWRLDVAADLGHSEEYNHYFWREFRRNVKEANPDAVILAEHYGDVRSWLNGDQWDTVMNYDAFMEPVSWFLTGMEKHSEEYNDAMRNNAENFLGVMSYHMAKLQTPSLQSTMNELSNHDHSRFLTRTNHRIGRTHYAGPEAANEGINPAVMRIAVLMQFTWPGSPTIYYGDEAGVCGWTDPDNRRTYPWGQEDQQMIDFHKEMIRIHKAYATFRLGSYVSLRNEPGCLVYGRFDKEQRIVVAINNNDYEKEISVPVWRIGGVSNEMWGNLILTGQWGFDCKATLQYVNQGHIKIKLGPESAVIIKNLNW